LLTSQIKLKDLVSFADEQYKKGDYYYALDFYQKAIAIDSNSLTLKWKYAQTLRAYKDYKAAEKRMGKSTPEMMAKIPGLYFVLWLNAKTEW
jgi:hypothetical protein